MDPSLITIQCNFANIPSGFVLENIVYNHLKTKGYAVFVGKTKRGEVDLLL